ncbi:MAG: HPr family phosphocarrier protein [Oscillospiraceae bacterium]|jgi:phosphotransferase system HPr-like phosphotransfer protein|nr:HPr family phosphocarrier protein [Oscillospiraceae bacterium]
MNTFHIKLVSIEDVKNFITEANKCPEDIDVVSGRYTIDAKSVLGIFSLDLSKTLEVVVHGTDKDAESFCEAVRSVVVEG